MQASVHMWLRVVMWLWVNILLLENTDLWVHMCLSVQYTSVWEDIVLVITHQLRVHTSLLLHIWLWVHACLWVHLGLLWCLITWCSYNSGLFPLCPISLSFSLLNIVRGLFKGRCCVDLLLLLTSCPYYPWIPWSSIPRPLVVPNQLVPYRVWCVKESLLPMSTDYLPLNTKRNVKLHL